MRDDKLIGVLTEEDIMRFVFGKPNLMTSKVVDAMSTTYAVVEKDFSVQNVVALLRGAPYTAVVDGNRFLGLITRADVLNHMRKQM